MQDQYWVHVDHPKAEAVEVADPAALNATVWANALPQVFDDRRSGLRETEFQIQRIEPAGTSATRVVLQLGCDRTLTSWCDLQQAQPQRRLKRT